MAETTLSSHEFKQNAGEALKAASNGPVFITDRGKPSHVLLPIEDYRRLVGAYLSVAHALAQDYAPEFDFEPVRLSDLARAAELD